MPSVMGTRRFEISCLLCAIVAAACVKDDGEDEANPPSGVWIYYDDGFGENTCGTADLQKDSDTTFTLDNNGDGTFTVHQETYGDFECTITGMEFDCPERLAIDEEFEDPANPGTVGATVSWQVSITGTFSSDTEASGEQIVNVTCVGDLCSLAPTVFGASLPCSYDILFHAEKAPDPS
jgi:hypothetical protein